MKTEIQTVRPFSSGSEAMDWQWNNCDRCVRAFKPAEGKNMPDYSTTQKLVNLGRECTMKYAIDMGYMTGEVSVEIAALVGWTEEKGWPDSCMMFSDDDNDEWKPAPRKPYGPDEQMCLPFAINDIVMNRTEILEAV